MAHLQLRANVPPPPELGLIENTSSPSRASISLADSATAVRATLIDLEGQEGAVMAQLDSLTASQRSLFRNFGRLDLLRASLAAQAISTRSVSHGILSDAATAAKRISAAVNRLDIEQDRVKGTLEVVEQVAELKACVLGVTGSMGAPQDWEAAAGYLSRASRIPKSIIDGLFAEQIVPTAEVPDPPNVTLAQAAESLRGLFLREFERAASENNGAKVTRFFKLFPLIGKPDVGLEVYGRYVCRGVAVRAREALNIGTGGSQRREGFFYASALTKLFEHIAQIVEHHGALVEIHYGAGSMIQVIERLQAEADVQGGIIIDTWTDERAIDRKLTDVKSYAFTFLVQSFLPAQPARSSTPRAVSPANRGFGTDSRVQNNEGIDSKDVDTLLGEITVMLARWALYSRFVAAKCRDVTSNSATEQYSLKPPSLLLNSTLLRKVADKLVAPNNIMTTFLLRRSVERAFQLDEQPPDLSFNLSKALHSNPPYMSSAVDDVMFVVNQVVERSLATSQRSVVSTIIPSIARVLESDFIGMMQRKMRDESYPKAAIQGALPPEQTIIAFLVLTNGLDVAIDYVRRIVQSRVDVPVNRNPARGDSERSTSMVASMYPFDGDAAFVTNALKSLQQTFEGKASELISDGIFVVFKNVVKPRLRPILADAFRDTDYQMTEEDLEELRRSAENEDVNDKMEGAVQFHFQRGWDALTKPIARILTQNNFDKLLSTMVSYLAEVLEKRIWSYHNRINDVGAVRLERDLLALIGIVVQGARYGLRDAFTRCTQISFVMNMEEDEWEELEVSAADQADAEMEWKIDREERLRAHTMVPKR